MIAMQLVDVYRGKWGKCDAVVVAGILSYNLFRQHNFEGFVSSEFTSNVKSRYVGLVTSI